MKPRHFPEIDFVGPAAVHDMCCGIHYDQPAVLHLNTGVFHPSWKAHTEGWRLVQAKNKFQVWLLKRIFGNDGVL